MAPKKHVHDNTFVSVVNVALSTGDDSIDPDAGGRIAGRLQMVAALLCLHDERAVRSATLRRVHVVQVDLVDGLQNDGHNFEELIYLFVRNSHKPLDDIPKNTRHHAACAPTCRRSISAPFSGDRIGTSGATSRET